MSKDNKKKNDPLEGEELEIDDFLLDSQKTDFIQQKKNRQKITTIRGISSEKPPVFKKRLILISLFLLAVFGVIQLFSPSDDKYITDSSFEKIDIPANTNESQVNKQIGDESEKSDFQIPKRNNIRSRKSTSPSPLSKSRRSTRSYKEKQRQRDQVVYDGGDTNEYDKVEEEVPAVKSKKNRIQNKVPIGKTRKRTDDIIESDQDVETSEDNDGLYENDSEDEQKERTDSEYEEEQESSPATDEEEEY